MPVTPFVITLILLTAGYVLYGRLKQVSQLKFINSYQFHPGIKKKLRRKHPTLSDAQIDMVFDGLRDYFHICRQVNGKIVAMPSQAVDDAWHEFILFTLIYQRFCSKALGRFLHHTPAEAMRSPTVAQDGIKRAWRLACIKEDINSKAPTRLPLLFAIDALLQIENGFVYSLDCRDRNSPLFGTGYCATHIGCAADCADGSDSGWDNSGSDSSSDSSGCSGGGCGGGGD